METSRTIVGFMTSMLMLSRGVAWACISVNTEYQRMIKNQHWVLQIHLKDHIWSQRRIFWTGGGSEPPQNTLGRISLPSGPGRLRGSREGPSGIVSSRRSFSCFLVWCVQPHTCFVLIPIIYFNLTDDERRPVALALLASSYWFLETFSLLWGIFIYVSVAWLKHFSLQF